MSIPPFTGLQRIADANGRPTPEFLQFMDRLLAVVEDNEDFRTAVNNVTKPSGGSTVDAEARTAIDAIIDAT